MRYAVLFVLALTSCAKQPTRTENVDLYERSTHRLSQPPQTAAACISRNAADAGYTAVVQPLFGTAAVAVNVRDHGPTGNTLATISMLPDAAGSRATVTNAREILRERKTVVESLIARC